MAHYERDHGSRPQALGDLAEVKALVASGALNGDSRLRVDGGPWMSAKDLPGLRSLFTPAADLWSAWDDEELDDEVPTPPAQRPHQGPQSASRASAPAPPPQPLPPPTPLDAAGATPQEEPEEIPHTHVVSVDPPALPHGALRPLPPPAPVGQVIAFPGPKRGSPRPKSAAAPRYETLPLLVEDGLEPMAPVLDKTEEQIPGRIQTRHFWMGAAVLGTALLTALTVGWVRSTAAWTSDAPLGPIVTPSVLPVLPEPVVVGEDPIPTPPQVAEPVLSEVVAQLRSKIPKEAQALGLDPSAMEDALFVELRRVVAVDRVQIRVLAFDVADRPSSLELKVVLQEEGAQDLSRSFAAIGLVAGKYVDQAGLNLPKVLVLLPTDEGTLEKAFDGERAGAFWRGELGAQAYLRGE